MTQTAQVAPVRTHMNVSQMGSQTSTDKFGDGGTKNTQTNQSINETFELTNMIGGASIEM